MKYQDQNDKLISIFSGSPIEAEMVNQLLNENDIETMIKNQLMGTLAPWQVSAGGNNPVEVIIHKSDIQKAQELVEDFRHGNN